MRLRWWSCSTLLNTTSADSTSPTPQRKVNTDTNVNTLFLLLMDFQIISGNAIPETPRRIMNGVIFIRNGHSSPLSSCSIVQKCGRKASAVMPTA